MRAAGHRGGLPRATAVVADVARPLAMRGLAALHRGPDTAKRDDSAVRSPFAVGGDGRRRGRGVVSGARRHRPPHDRDDRRAGAGQRASIYQHRPHGLTPHDIYPRDAPGVVFVRAQIVEQDAGRSVRSRIRSAAQGSTATGSGFLINPRGQHPHQLPRDRRAPTAAPGSRSSSRTTLTRPATSSARTSATTSRMLKVEHARRSCLKPLTARRSRRSGSATRPSPSATRSASTAR